jgi:predicted  nucleic acid-binding Zn-ribbon protein
MNAMKKNKFSVSSITNEIGGSRTVYYNHNSLLNRYIEYSSERFNKKNYEMKIVTMSEQIKSLKEDIGLLHLRDVDVKLIEEKNKRLNDKLKASKKEIERQKLRVSNLSNKIKELS